MSLFGPTIPALISEEVHAWLKREQAARPGADVDMLMQALATRLNRNKRQLYRWMSGETPVPLEVAVPLCKAIGSLRLLQLVNQYAGLLAEPTPDVGKLDGFDLIIEQSRNLREFGELVATYAAATDAVPSEIELRRIEKEGREAIQQIERLIAIYRELAARQVGLV
jgi:hypothetical protein